MPSTRSLWTQKLLSATPQVLQSGLPAKTARMIKRPAPVVISAFRGIALGVDPSVRATGFSVVECSATGFRVLESKTLRCPAKMTFLECLGAIHRESMSLLSRYQIGRVGVENTIYVNNFQTVQLLGCARGAALGPLAAAGIEIVQMSPKTIKQSVTMTGSADKAMVQRMVSSITGCSILPEDEADATAAGIACSMGKNLAAAA